MDPQGRERRRLEGYLPKEEFRLNLEMGLARVAFMRKDWPEAERRYAAIADQDPASKFAPEALYWRGVSKYKSTHDHTALSDVAETLVEKYRDSLWAKRSLPWLH